MRKITCFLLLCICFTNCKSSKKTVSKKPRTKKVITKKGSNTSSSKTTNIIDYAKTFEGVRYKYGGTTKKGMDCSGLVVTSYKSEDVLLPRTTRDLSTTGSWIDLKKVKEGDLLFFATKKNSRNINHVGIVTKTRAGHVEFIHSTTSKGVITSSLAERYWYLAFVQARRVL